MTNGGQMMGAEKTLVNVNKGQDAYSVIGNYILNHVTAIEDMIAAIQINGVVIKELYMADVEEVYRHIQQCVRVRMARCRMYRAQPWYKKEKMKDERLQRHR